MNIPEIYLIEPYNAYAPKGRKKHWHEIVEEQALMARIIAEQQAIQEAKSTTTPPDWPPDSVATVGTVGAAAAAGAGGQPPPDFFNPGTDVIEFTWAPTTAAAPVTVVFTNQTTTAQFDIYNWYFGDGASALNTLSPTHVYDTGSFSCSLQVTNSITSVPGGETIHVISCSIPVVTARFTYVTSSGPAPTTASFTNTSTNTSQTATTIYLWKFGDGLSSSLQAPAAHPYATSSTGVAGLGTGSYTASIAVTGSYGITSYYTQSFFVPAPTLNARFTYTTTSLGSPISASFLNGTLQNYNGKGTLTYKMDFGDATATSSTANVPSHPYTNTGSFTASLQVTESSYGIMSLYTQSFLVPAPTLTAGFTYTTTSLGSPISASFTDTTVYNSYGTKTYLWNFGDGTTATTQNVSNHPYTNTGSFTASLQVTESKYNIMSFYTQSFLVPDSTLVAAFTMSWNSDTAPSTVTFTNTLNGANGTQYNGSGFLTYLWDLGTGSITATSQIPNPQLYTAAGPYTASLQVTESRLNHMSYYTQSWLLG